MRERDPIYIALTTSNHLVTDAKPMAHNHSAAWVSRFVLAYCIENVSLARCCPLSLRERLQNPTSTQLPLLCLPNLGFLSRDLGPTVRDSVFVTGHFWMRMIFSEIVWGWVKRSCEGGFSVARTGEGGSTPWICAPKCSLRDT